MDRASTTETSTDESEDDSDNERKFKRNLVSAVEQNNFGTLQELFNKSKFPVSSFVDTRDSTDNNNTLLHIAVRTRKRKIQDENTNIVKLLVSRGADIQAKNDREETPFCLLEKSFKSNAHKVDWTTIRQILSVNQASGSKPKISKKNTNNALQSKTNNKKKADSSKDEPTLQNDPDEEEMETEEFSFTGNPTYSSSGLKTSLHGVIYQLQLLILYLHRATKMYESICLATELDKAEKFDDVVLKYKKSKDDRAWTWRFLQAKHLLHAKKDRIKKAELFSKNEKQKAKFPFHKYFVSFCKIKDNPYFTGDILEEFTICTNTLFDADAKTYFKEDKDFKNDNILFFKNETMQKYKLQPIAKEHIREIYKLIVKKRPEEKYLYEFLDKFRFVVNYPDRNRINRLITKELGRYFGLLNSDLATNTFKNNVLNWFMSYKGGKSEFLLIKDGKCFLRSIKNCIKLLMTSGLSLAYPEKLGNYILEFANIPSGITEFINTDKFQILYITAEVPLLSSIKISQYLRQSKIYRFKDKVIFLQLKTLSIPNVRDLVYKSFSAETAYDILIIDCGMDCKLKHNTLNSIYLRLLDIVCENPSKKIILIGESKNKLSAKMMDANSGIASAKVDDLSSYASLIPSVQTSLLDKSICLQGRQLKLKDIINISSANLLINNYMLVKLLKGEEIRIDDAPSPNGTFFTGKYVERNLSHQIISRDVLRNEKFLKNKIVLVSKADHKTLLALGADKNKINIWTETMKIENGIVLIEDVSRSANIIEEIYKSNSQSNIYWLEHQNGELIWKQFIGEARCLKPFIDTKAATGRINEGELLRSYKKIIIIAADPGFGKSSLLYSLNEKLSSIYPHQWTKRINLSNYVSSKQYLNKTAINQKLLADIDFCETDTEKAISFLADMLFAADLRNEETCFQKTLFRLSLQSFPGNCKYPEITLMFDGFDEISPKYKKQTLIMLKALQKSNVTQLWVTTRTHEQCSLEDVLTIPALRLNHFSNKQKFDYINSFSRSAPQESIYEVYSKICSCLETISLSSENPSTLLRTYLGRRQSRKNLHDILKEEFTKVPLHLRMLVEVAFSANDSLSEQLNMPSLYKKFVDNKFNIYYEEKTSTSSRVQADEDMRKRDLEALFDIHASLAFETLFPNLAEETCKFDEQPLTRIGFIVVSEHRIQFTHRSFAEYFVVTYLAKHIKEENIQNLIWDSVLVRPRYNLLRSFVNENEGLLFNWFTSNALKEKILLIEYKNMFYAIEEKLCNIVKPILLLLKKTGNATLNKIKGINSHFQNYKTNRKFEILFNMLQYDEHFFSVMLPMIMTTENDSYLNQGFNPIHILFSYYTGSDISDILDHIYKAESITHTSQATTRICDMLTEKCGSNSIFHIASLRGQFGYIKQLIIWSKENLANTFISDTESGNTLKNIQTEPDDNVREGILTKLLYMLDYKHRTFLQVMRYNATCNDFLNYLFQEFGQMEMKRLFGATDGVCRTILHSSVESGIESKQNNILRILLESFKDYFDADTVKKIVFSVDDIGRTALHLHPNKCDYSVCPYRMLLDFSLRYFQPNVFKELLLMKDHKGKCILHNAVENSKNLEGLLNYMKCNYDLEDIGEFIFCFDEKRRTPLHLAVRKGDSSNSMLALLDFSKCLLGEDSLKQLLFSEDINGMTVLHHSCYCRNSGQVSKALLEYAKSALNITDFTSFTLKRDFKQQTVLHHASHCTAIITILEVYRSYLGMPFIESVIMKTDDNGQTVLHNAAEGRYPYVTTALLKYARNNLDINLFIRILLKKNNAGKTAFDVMYPNKENYIDIGTFPSFYTWLIFTLQSSSEESSNKAEKTFNIYWSEIDSLYGYARRSCMCFPELYLEDQLVDILNKVSDHQSWKQLSSDERILKLEYHPARFVEMESV